MTGYKYPRIEREHIPPTVQELEIILNKLLTLIVFRKISRNDDYYYLAISSLFIYLFQQNEIRINISVTTVSLSRSLFGMNFCLVNEITMKSFSKIYRTESNLNCMSHRSCIKLTHTT